MKHIEEYEKYDTKLVYYPNGDTVIKFYEKDIYRKISGVEKESNSKGRVSSSESEGKVIRSDSLSRTRDLIVQYGKQHIYEWKSFWTFTYAENMTDIDRAYKDYDNWKNQFKRYGKKIYGKDFDFKILGVPEFQKRGAIHFHFISDIDPKIFTELLTYQKSVIDKDGYEKKMYDVKYWKHGFTRVDDFSMYDNDTFNPVLYMLKYLYKDLDSRLFGRNKILKTNNLKKGTEFILDSEKEMEKIQQIYDYLYSAGTFEIKEKDVTPTKEYALSFKEITMSNKCMSDINHDVIISEILGDSNNNLAF